MTTTHPSVYELEATLERIRGLVRPQVGVRVLEVAPDWVFPVRCRAPRCEAGLTNPHPPEMCTWWMVDPAAIECTMTFIPGPAYQPKRRLRMHCEAGLESVQELVHQLPYVIAVGVDFVVRRATR
jgi:hypothetical protein